MMKKYLMTGLVAVALSGLFSGCSQEIETGVETTTEFNVLQNYENAFVSRFGQPAADQDWGFSSVAGTRTENANANEWADPNKAYGGLLVPPPLTAEQIALVKKYFQSVPNIEYEDPHWTNYFIQQVYKGNPTTAGSNSPEQYLAANGSTWIIGSNNMDHLAAINGDFVDHINNFNHGDCSPNSNVLNNGGNANSGPFHTDKIMYMKESTTASFGYYNSNGSIRRTEYTGLVSWQTIRTWARQQGIYKEDILNDSWNRSFMGFDFEQMIGPEILTGATFEFDGKQYNFLTANTNMYCVDRNEKSYSTIGGVANFNDRPSDATIRDLLSKGYLPTSDTLKDWAKVGGCADGYYSDWIVTLTEAKKGPTPPPSGFVCRIIAEDLTVGENSDFDFNDVVFDVIDYGATIRLRAAGGELPLYVDGHEVHKEFGFTNSYPLINTGWNGSLDYYNYYVDFPSSGDYSTREKANDIPVIVTKKGKNEELYNILLTAEKGKVASKVCVGSDYKWCRERQDIDDKYHIGNGIDEGTRLFQQYIIGNLRGDWATGNAWYQQVGQ